METFSVRRKLKSLVFDGILCIFFLFVYFWRHSPPVGYDLLILEVSRSHTTTQHSRYSSGRVISSSQRPLPDNTQQSQQTDIHAPGGNRTHNFSRRAAADLRLRPRGHWDWHEYLLVQSNFPKGYLR